MNAVLFDLDGVLYQGNNTIPGARKTIAWFQQREIPHLFLTNTTSKPRRALVEKLAQLGLKVNASQILTPPVAAVSWIKQHTSGPVALFIPPATQEEFIELPLIDDSAESGATAIVIGDLGKAWDFATLNRAFRLLMRDPKPTLVALGMTRYWYAADGLSLDTAPFVVALEYASGAQAQVLGKPAGPFFQAALAILGSSATDTVMIGDDIRGDVQGAQKAGLHGILVRTGKFQPHDLEQGINPDAVLNSIADLPTWWQTHAQNL